MVQIQRCERRRQPTYSLHPKFGSVFSAHMLRMDFSSENQSEWSANIIPYGPEPVSPSNLTLHYGQSIFEGMKAYKQPDGRAAIFRLDLHAKRFANSAARVAMPRLPEDVFTECLKAYVEFESDFVPMDEGHSLYLRPMMIARDEIIKVGRSKHYSFYILSTIAGSYFHAGGLKPAKVLVNREFVRAYPGGMGEAKTSANYAASLYPQTVAERLGCDQVLYLDGVKHENIDELGGMNFFVVDGKRLLTPKLNGCILNGVTRKSILELAPSLGLETVETELKFSEVVDGIRSGRIREAFACGTAAVVSPIGEIVYLENEKSTPQTITLQNDFSTAKMLLETLSKIHRGQKKAPGHWLFDVSN